MTLSSSDIPLMSPFTVSDGAGSRFTTAEFNRHFTKAKARLDLEDPGLGADDYDQAHGLLVCHLHELKLGSANMRSQSLGDYSYTRDSNGSSFLQEYRELLKSGGARKSPSTARERCDKDMGDFDLDQGNIPSYGEE